MTTRKRTDVHDTTTRAWRYSDEAVRRHEAAAAISSAALEAALDATDAELDATDQV